MILIVSFYPSHLAGRIFSVNIFHHMYYCQPFVLFPHQLDTKIKKIILIFQSIISDRETQKQRHSDERAFVFKKQIDSYNRRCFFGCKIRFESLRILVVVLFAIAVVVVLKSTT